MRKFQVLFWAALLLPAYVLAYEMEMTTSGQHVQVNSDAAGDATITVSDEHGVIYTANGRCEWVPILPEGSCRWFVFELPDGITVEVTILPGQGPGGTDVGHYRVYDEGGALVSDKLIEA